MQKNGLYKFQFEKIEALLSKIERVLVFGVEGGFWEVKGCFGINYV
jgi:hypothetical protein